MKETDNQSTEPLDVCLNALGIVLPVVVAGATALLTTQPIGPVGVAFVTAGMTYLTGQMSTAISIMKERRSSRREKERALSALVFAANEVGRRLEQGEIPRDDEFLKIGTNSFSDADAILEAMLAAAERQHQESKLYYLGKLYASIVFHSNISTDVENHLINLARNLTYRQYLFLANIVLSADATGSGKLGHTRLNRNSAQPDILALLSEIIELNRIELITHDYDSDPIGGPIAIVPDELRLTSLGHVLCEAMNLSELRERDSTSFDRTLKLLT